MLPVIVFTAYLCTRSQSIDGIDFIVVDALTFVGIILGSALFTVGVIWWNECGHGYFDAAQLFLCVAPIAILVYKLDALGQVPV